MQCIIYWLLRYLATGIAELYGKNYCHQRLKNIDKYTSHRITKQNTCFLEVGKLLNAYNEPNIDIILLDFINNEVAQKDSANYSYADLLACAGLLLLLPCATCITSLRQRILEHIITSHPLQFFITGTISCDITDHLPVFAKSKSAN